MTFPRILRAGALLQPAVIRAAEVAAETDSGRHPSPAVQAALVELEGRLEAGDGVSLAEERVCDALGITGDE